MSEDACLPSHPPGTGRLTRAGPGSPPGGFPWSHLQGGVGGPELEPAQLTLKERPVLEKVHSALSTLDVQG